MKLYHCSNIFGLNVLKPHSQINQNRPDGVYLTDIHHLGLWLSVIQEYNPDLPIYIYEVDLPDDEICLFGEDNFTNYIYEEKTIIDCVEKMKSIICIDASEIVINHEIPCKMLMLDVETIRNFHRYQLFLIEMEENKSIFDSSIEINPSELNNIATKSWQYKEIFNTK